eukprot:5710163-Alexandrium_andersonii.AAC.1
MSGRAVSRTSSDTPRQAPGTSSRAVGPWPPMGRSTKREACELSIRREGPPWHWPGGASPVHPRRAPHVL